MARCSNCGKETEMYVNGVPLCLECDKRREADLRKPPAPNEAPLKKLKRSLARIAGAVGLAVPTV